MKTCLIFRTDRIGDMVCSIPALYMCRMLLPDHHIVLVASSYTLSLIQDLECIDTVIPSIDDFRNSFDITTLGTIEYSIAMNQTPEIIECIKTIQAPHTIGLRKSIESFFLFNNGRFAKYFFQKEKNESQRMLDLVRNINPQKFDILYPSMPPIHLQYKEHHRRKVHDFFTNNTIHNKNVICLNPIKEGASKSVPDSMYPPLLRAIEENFPDTPILVSGVEQDAKRITSFIHDSGCNNALLYTHSYDLLDCVALLDAVTVFIGSSTGPTHIAAMLNKDTIAFYPYEKKHSPERWGSFTKGNINYILSKGNVDAPKNMNHSDLFSQRHIDQTILAISKYLSPTISTLS